MSAALDFDRIQFANAAPTANGEPVSRWDFAEFSSDLLRGMRRLHMQHGPIAAIEDGGQRVVFVFDPEFNQQVLSDTERFHAHFFAVRGPKRSSQRRLTCGLLAMNGEQHRRNRRMVKEPFGLKAISTYGETIQRLTDNMLAGWRVGDVRDMAEEMRHYMLLVTSTMLFGFDDPEAAYRLGDMIARWVELNEEVGVGALVPNDRFSDRYEELLTFADELEAEIREMIRRRRESREPGTDVLSILVRTHDEQGGLSDEELIGQSAVLFGAAHMTTAHSLTWTLLLLAQHPSVMRELWAELNANGESAKSGSPKSLGSLAKGDDLSLFDRVIKESMRLLPASAYSQRITTEPVQLGPFQLLRGTGIVFTPLVTHHLASLYPDPDRFRPDRWLSLRPSPYAYHPFGGGPRLCIGGPLATAIMRLALERILSRFRLTVVPNASVNVHVQSTMLVPTNGLPMEITAADGQFTSSPMSGSVHELVEFDEVPGGKPDDLVTVADRSPAPRRPR